MSRSVNSPTDRLRQGAVLFAYAAGLGMLTWQTKADQRLSPGPQEGRTLSGTLAGQVNTASQPGHALSDDARLDAKITVTAEGIPIGDLLTLLAKKTGILLRAERYIADDKVIVFSAGRPLRTTMANVAALFNDTWVAVPTGSGKTGYELRRSLQAREYENRLAEAIPARMMALIEAQVRALDETPDQFVRRPANDPIVRNLRHEGGRLATALYSRLSVEQQRSLFARRALSVSLEGLNAPLSQAVREVFEGSIPKQVGTTPQEGSTEANVIPADSTLYLQNLDKYGVMFTISTASDLTVKAQLGLQEGLTVGRFALDAVRLPISSNPYTGEKTSSNAILPDARAIQNAAKESTLLDRLHSLAATGIAIVADYYRSPAELQDDHAPETTSHSAVTALNALCQREDYLWWMRSNTLLLRRRAWFLQRKAEIPDQWILRMAQRLKAHKGVPTYDDVFQLLELTPAQIAGLDDLVGGRQEALDKAPALGVREALQVWQASGRDKNRPISAQGGTLPMVQDDQKVVEGEGYMCYTLMGSVQRGLLSDFLASQPQRLAAQDLSILMLYINGLDTSAFSQTHTTQEGYRYAPVTVGWNLYKPYVPAPAPASVQAGMPPSRPLNAADFVPKWGHLWSVPLPASLPQDRRDHTRIEILP